MPRRPKIRIAILLPCLAGPCAAFAQDSRSVRLVEITSTQTPYDAPPMMKGKASQPPDANPNRTELAIRKEGDAYKLNGQAVDPNLIASLVIALTAPANPELNLDDLDVTPAWLKEHAASVAQRISETTFIGRAHVRKPRRNQLSRIPSSWARSSPNDSTAATTIASIAFTPSFR